MNFVATTFIELSLVNIKQQYKCHCFCYFTEKNAVMYGFSSLQFLHMAFTTLALTQRMSHVIAMSAIRYCTWPRLAVLERAGERGVEW